MDVRRRLLRFALKALRYSTRAVARLERRLGLDQVSESEHHKNVALSMTRYDMVANPDEAYYRDQYLHWIDQALGKVGMSLAPVCIDLGCGQGRLTLALADRFPRSEVLGID